MPLTNNTNVGFYSGWDIDKVIDYQDSSTNSNLSFSVLGGGAGGVSVPNTYGGRKYVEAQYKPSTQSTWFSPGENLQFSTSQLVIMNVWVSSSTIEFFVENGHAGAVTVQLRYWVFTDGN